MFNRIKKFKLGMSTTQKIMLSFLLVIFLGSILLSLPISTKTGESVSYIDALFTATTATCVTGLVTLPTVTTWSIFGQVVILLLIQVGGLGVITIITGVFVGMHKRMGIRDSMLIQDAFNLNTLSGLHEFVKKVIWGTFLVEGIGAVFYMFVLYRSMALEVFGYLFLIRFRLFVMRGLILFQKTVCASMCIILWLIL